MHHCKLQPNKMIKKIFTTIKNTAAAKSGAILIGTMVVSSIINFVFNAYLGRTLNYTEYFIVSLVVTLYNFANMIVSALSSTVNHQVSELSAQGKPDSAVEYQKNIREIAITILVSITALILICSPLIANYFNTDNISAIVSITLVLAFLGYNNIMHAWFQGMLFFNYVALLFITESFSKLMIALFFTQIGESDVTYLSVPISVILTSVVAAILYKNHSSVKEISEINVPKFARKFFATALLTGFATSAFLNIDILVAAHYLQPEEAGKYAILSLIGKLIFFFGSLLNVFTITLTTRAHTENKSTQSVLYLILGVTSAAVGVMYLVIGFAGSITAPLIFGDNARAITHLLPTYALAISLYTISTYIVNYHLALKHYLSPFVSISSTLVLLMLATFQHNTIEDLAGVVLTASIYNIVMLLILHVGYARGKFVLSNTLDLLDLFKFNFSQRSETTKHILLMNWRDTRHNLAGGAEVYVHELAKSWVKNAYQVSMITSNDGHSLRSEIVDGVFIIRRGGFFTVYIWAFIYYTLKFRGNVDYVVESQNGAPFLTPWYVKEKNIAIIHHINQSIFKRSLPKPFALLACSIEKHFMPHVYRNTKIIVVSPSTKKELQDLVSENLDIDIVYNGVDTKSYIPGKKSYIPTILYLGRLKKYKQVDLLIEAAKDIQKEMPAFQCIIAGDGEERAYLQEKVTSLGLRPNVIFKGKVSESEKIHLYQQAWITVQPSMMEGWGITAIESNACGTPVVAFNVPGLRDAIKHDHSGRLLDTHTSQELSKELLSLLSDSSYRQRLSSFSRIWAEEFSWEKSALEALNIITTSQVNSEIITIDDLSSKLAYDQLYK